jgi:hypothetical protein
VINILSVEKFLSFCVDVGRIVASSSKNIFKLGVRVHIPSYKPTSFFKNENILSACTDFFAVEIDIAFANSDFTSVYEFMSEYSATTFTSSPCISSVKARFSFKKPFH